MKLAFSFLSVLSLIVVLLAAAAACLTWGGVDSFGPGLRPRTIFWIAVAAGFVFLSLVGWTFKWRGFRTSNPGAHPGEFLGDVVIPAMSGDNPSDEENLRAFGNPLHPGLDETQTRRVRLRACGSCLFFLLGVPLLVLLLVLEERGAGSAVRGLIQLLGPTLPVAAGWFVLLQLKYGQL